MKKLSSIIAALFISVAATFAQVPQAFSYQAVVRDAQNAIVANQVVEVTVTILQGDDAASATPVFSEKHSAQTNTNGLFALTIGSQDAAKFAAINWAGGNLYLKTESQYGTTTTQLLSVPFALYAENANVDLSDYYSKYEIEALLENLKNEICNCGCGGTSQQLDGAIKAAFSVSADKQIYFSQGNLQYQASTGTWRFAEHQYDMIGSGNTNISSTYSGWIDMFGWGTSGYKGKNPYMTDGSEDAYGDGTNDIAGTNFDWGVYNAISNGGNQAGQWRTLTKEEWSYLINTRTDASNKFGVARVNDVNGLILLPDNWTLPDGLAFTNGANGNFAQNTYSAADWSRMEANGAVFLPAGGNRLTTGIDKVDSNGYYWSSSAGDNKYAHKNAGYLLIGSGGVYAYNCRRAYGQSVRLVRRTN